MSINAEGSKELVKKEREDATMTCSFLLNRTAEPHLSNIARFSWIYNVGQTELQPFAKYCNERSIACFFLHQQQPISFKDRSYEIIKTDNSSSLIIDNLTVGDEGPYYCHLYQEFTVNNQIVFDTFNLTILVPPEDLKLKVAEEYVQNNESATFICSVPRVKPNVTEMKIQVGDQSYTSNEQPI